VAEVRSRMRGLLSTVAVKLPLRDSHRKASDFAGR
jgi:hypothetical protein